MRRLTRVAPTSGSGPGVGRPGEILTSRHYAWLAAFVFAAAVYGSLIPFQFRPLPFAEAVAIFDGMPSVGESAERMVRFAGALLGWCERAPDRVPLPGGRGSEDDNADAVGDWIISALLFLLASFLFMGALTVDRTGAVGFWQSAAVVGPLCVTLAVVIEFVQIYFPPRTISGMDILVQALGAVVGVALWPVAGRRLTCWVRQYRDARDLTDLAQMLFPAFLVLLLVVELMPFDVILTRGDWERKWEAGRIALAPGLAVAEATSLAEADSTAGRAGIVRTVLLNLITNFARFFPLGLLYAIRGSRQSALQVLLLAAAVVGILEGLKILVYSARTTASDLLVGPAVVWLGWHCGRTLVRSGFPARMGTRSLAVAARMSLVAWLALVLYFNWEPFNFAASPPPVLFDNAENYREEIEAMPFPWLQWLPLADYYWGSKANLFKQFVGKTGSFLPLGVFLGWILLPGVGAGRSRRAGWIVVASAAAVSIVLALGRYYLPHRAPSVTDILFQCFGAWVGFFLIAHLWPRMVAPVNGDPLPGGRGSEAQPSPSPSPPAPLPEGEGGRVRPGGDARATTRMVAPVTDAAGAPGGAVAETLSVTLIEPRRRRRYLDPAELWRYRELLFFLTWRDVKIRYKQTALGAAWAVLQPLATMIVFSVFLGKAAAKEGDAVAYPLFVFAGLLPWIFFANAVGTAGQSIVSNQNLVTKVYFPRLIIPMSAVGAGLIDLLAGLGMLVVLMVLYGIAPGWGVLAAPVLIVWTASAAVGVGALLSALTVAYRDFRHAAPFLIQLWMFATPSIYMQTIVATPGTDGSDSLRRALLSLNPLHGLIDNFRRAMLGVDFDWVSLSVSGLVSVVLLAVGCSYFRRVERAFADII